MAIQFGTIDGLVNITESNIHFFVKAISEFVKLNAPAYAKEKNIAFGAAFQRFVEPVYTNKATEYKLESIDIPVYTQSGREQSPARITFARKLGLLEIDEHEGIFNLTPLGNAILNKDITIEEYAFLLLTKMGVFNDGKYIDNVFSTFSSYFQNKSTISPSLLKEYVENQYNNPNFEKTRFDIIFNAVVTAGLITKVTNDIYVLSNTEYASIFSDFFKNRAMLSPAIIDGEPYYSNYMGALEHGVFDLLTKDNIDIYTKCYPNLLKYDKQNKDVITSSILISENKLTSFVLGVIHYLNNIDGLNSINEYASNGPNIKVSKENCFSLVGMFLESTIEEVKDRNINRQRWFEDEFKLGDRNVFLSTQWNSQGDFQLTLSDLMKMINCCYGNIYSYQTGPNGEHQFYLTKRRTPAAVVKQGPLQQIFYGAPGTGKSFVSKKLTKYKEVIRTTFHPDSDYSTFVGAYKPTSIEYPVRDVTGKVIVENGKQVTENRIVYEFVEQAFLQSYIKAWKAYAACEAGQKPIEQYLIIEEINRGNCAQIFGDLFQLLDRNQYGLSDYPITADKDMKKQLAKAFKDLTIADADRINAIYEKDVVSKVLSGDVLLLPDNLFIWATMNTSDQSLFPIDSAFKRRWDWKYIPISKATDADYKIIVNGKVYDWWTFVTKINDEIEELTKSEDKKLGYFFCKSYNGIIDAETFVGKVIFYLWTDVFKDQDTASFFLDGEDELSFSKFYSTDATGKTVVKEDKVEVFLKNLGLEPLTEEEKIEEVEDDDEEGENVPFTLP